MNVFSLLLCLSLPPSECGVWPRGVVALLPTGLPPLPQPQLRGPPRGSGGGPDPGRGGAPELRAASAGAVPLLDLLLRLHAVHHVRGLLECLRL